MMVAAVHAMAPTALLLLVLAALSPIAQAAFVRANCRGIQEFSMSEGEVSCQESSVLSDDAEHLMLGHTRATASLRRGRLISSAAGGQIRDVGSNGGEAGALLMDRLTIVGDWQGHVEVRVRLCVAYRFAGFGESRIHVALRSSSHHHGDGDNLARVGMRHRGFRGTMLEDLESRGAFTIPAEGSRSSRAIFELEVSQRVHRDSPVMNVRADLATYALPNLEALEPLLSSFAEAVAWLVVSLPESLAFASESGVFLSGQRAKGAMGSKPATDPSWGIIATSVIGNRDALRNYRGWHRAVARPDCRHQLGVDG